MSSWFLVSGAEFPMCKWWSSIIDNLNFVIVADYVEIERDGEMMKFRRKI
jgi:hypothetical protein